MKKYLPVLLVISPFFLFKLVNLSIRLSDSNIYFYTAYQLLQGKILYKDIFFTNFPLLPYASIVYFLISSGNLFFYFLTPAIEAAIVGALLYVISYKKYKDVLLSLTSTALYCFSFIVLATSDHQSGVFLASLFALVSYYFFAEKKYILSGVFVAFMILTKAYFMPILLAYVTTLFFERVKRVEKKYVLDFARIIIQFFIALLITFFIILLPTILYAFPDFIKDVFIYSLTRTQGVEKGRLLSFFISHDFILFLLLLFNLFLITKKHFFGFLSFFGILFFFFYQDIYYLYLNFFLPFLCLSYPYWYQTIQKKYHFQKYIIPTIICIFLLFNFMQYYNGFRNLQKIQIDEIVAAIKKENPKYLYGINSLTPALAYTANVPLLNNIVDTNPNIYRKGYLNANILTTKALGTNTLLVAEGIDYPLYNIKENMINEIFQKEVIVKYCTVLSEYPIQNEGYTNKIQLGTCKK